VRLAELYDGFLVDLDGVVWLGHEMIPGAAETLNRLEAAGKPVAFVTNSPRLSPAEQAEVLANGGVEVAEERIVTAGSTLIAAAIEQFGPGPRVIATGTDSFLRQLEGAGIELLPHSGWQGAEAVLVSGHPGFDYGELKAASMAARAGAMLAATGRDPTMPMPDGYWPGTGSILAAIETASGRKAIITGKPEKRIFEAGLEAIGFEAPDGGSAEGTRVAMIGDRADTDVGGAQSAGLDGILVGDHEAAGVNPDHRIGDLAGLMADTG
jgi:HAD superfamily hydrolase (TIGR01450 family)